MKLYKKIDLFYLGDYLCSTKQSKTCREAKVKYLENLEDINHSFAGLNLVASRVLKNPQHLKARFSKELK